MRFIAASLVAFLPPLPQVRPWRGRGHEPHRGNLWNRGLSGEPVPCEQAGLRIPLGDTTPGEVAALLVLVSVSGMRRGRDAQRLCQGWQEVGAKSEERSRAPGPSICLRDETGKRWQVVGARTCKSEERSCERLRMKVPGPSAKTRAVEKAVIGGLPSRNLRGSFKGRGWPSINAGRNA